MIIIISVFCCANACQDILSLSNLRLARDCVPLIISIINNAIAFRDQLQQWPPRYQTAGKQIESNRGRLQLNLNASEISAHMLNMVRVEERKGEEDSQVRNCPKNSN